MAPTTEDVQQRVQVALDRLVASGRETGLQAAAYFRGELVASAAAGIADPVTEEPLTTSTLVHSFSTAKGVTATLAHVLALRHDLDYDTPVARYWPEFAAHGKDRITLRHVLTHTAGVPHLPADTVPRDMADWDGMCARIAGLTPLWEPGTAMGYHGWTFGWILGEVIRRVSGSPVSTALRSYVAEPLGIEDSLFFGLPGSEHHRAATLVEGNWDAAIASMPDSASIFIASPRAIAAGSDFGNDKSYLSADIPAAGTMTAAAAARMYAALMTEVDGVRLLPADRLADVSRLAVAEQDRMLGHPSPKTLGYFHGITWAGGSPQSFGTTGSGGSAAFADPEHGIAFALTKNRLTADSYAAQTVAAEVYAALGRNA
jgi:CubicO group peptidase (beta-lactamase class C family)